MIRSALIRILLLLAFCSMASAATGEVFVNQTVWVTSDQPVQIYMLPPHDDVASCTAVPPLFCEQIDGRWFISLDPDGMPPHTKMHHFVTFAAGAETRTILVNITVWNLAPAHGGGVNLSAITQPDLLDNIDGVTRSYLSVIMALGALMIVHVNRRRFR